MPDFVLGVVNIRGRIVPVFDLRKKFKLKEKVEDDSTKLIVGNIEGVLVSLLIDEILDNIKLQRSKIDPVPPVNNNIDKECIDGIGVFSERMVILLNFIKIHENINRSLKKDCKSEL
jgi:purine-binding chemotaxis protein CheW